MKNYSDYELELLQKRGLYASVAPLLYPMLIDREKEITSNLINDFRTGKTDFTAKVAQLATIAELKEELISKESQIKALESRGDK